MIISSQSLGVIEHFRHPFSIKKGENIPVVLNVRIRFLSNPLKIRLFLLSPAAGPFFTAKDLFLTKSRLLPQAFFIGGQFFEISRFVFDFRLFAPLWLFALILLLFFTYNLGNPICFVRFEAKLCKSTRWEEKFHEYESVGDARHDLEDDELPQSR